LYWQGLELANGFHELADAHEQRRRFELDLTLRSAQNKQRPPVDEYLLGALQAGLPDCAGVAVGMDRLLALLMGKNSLAPVLSFPIDRI
jgi:lysyl-tRNA synthetase class 2